MSSISNPSPLGAIAQRIIDNRKVTRTGRSHYVEFERLVAEDGGQRIWLKAVTDRGTEAIVAQRGATVADNVDDIVRQFRQIVETLVEESAS